jgi:hypothetical protein
MLAMMVLFMGNSMEHLFVSSDGALFDTRMPDWASHPLRADYRRTHSEINSTLELRAATARWRLRVARRGYPLFFVTSDGAALSFETVRAEYAQCSRAIRERSRDGWRIVACEVNWEDIELTCEHSGKRIPSAYGSDK